jgi:hypothetical protein
MSSALKLIVKITLNVILGDIKLLQYVQVWKLEGRRD